MTDPGWSRVLAVARRSRFAKVRVRVRDDEVELHRQPLAPAVDRRSTPAGQDPPAPVVVTAQAPGMVTVHTTAGSDVDQGAAVGAVQVHDSTVALTSPVAGRVERVHVDDGAFVEYGTAVLSIMPSRD